MNTVIIIAAMIGILAVCLGMGWWLGGRYLKKRP